MGSSVLLEERAQSQELASYVVRTFQGSALPECYRAYVFSKWMRSLKHGNDLYKLIDSPSYYPVYGRHIAALLLLPAAVVRLAVLSDDPDVLLGFCVTRGPILDYLYVHPDQRRQKIAAHMLPEGITTITHFTRTGLSIWGSKYSHWKFNPFA